MRKIYSFALSAVVALASAVTATAAQPMSADMAPAQARESFRTIKPLLEQAPVVAKAPVAKAEANADAPESIVGKTYVAVYNDQTYDLNCGVKVVAGTDGGIVLEGFAEGYDVKATYDAATGTVSIPTGVVVGTHSTYGDITIHAITSTGVEDTPIIGKVEGEIITFQSGLYGTVVYNGQPGGLLIMTKIEATEANGKMSATLTNSSTGATTTYDVPLLVTKNSETSLTIVGISNFLGGRYYEVPFSFSESTKTATMTFGTPVDAVRASSTTTNIYFLGGINPLDMIDNLELSIVTSDVNTLMSASTKGAFYGYQNGTGYRGYTMNPFSITVDFNIFTGEATGEDPEDTDTPTIDGINYQLDREKGEATVTGCLPTLTNANIPAQITCAGKTYDVVAVAAAAFQGNSAMTTLTLPASIKTIGTDAFRNLRGIKSVYLPDLASWCAVEMANGNASPIYSLYSSSSSSRWGKLYIAGEAAPTDIVIPEGVTKMGRTFYGYKPLTSVKLPSTLTELGDQTFANCANLTEVEVPAGVETIGSAFWSCSGLKTAKLNDGLKTLKGSTFYGCRALESVNLPEGLETIGAMTFSSCNALKTLTLPASLKTISRMGLYGASGLTELKSLAAVPATAETMAFEDIDTSIPVYVPAASIDAYKAAEEWKNFTNYVALPGDSGIDSAVADEADAPAVYYNLQGVRVDNPEKGLYIKRQGNKTTKVVL